MYSGTLFRMFFNWNFFFHLCLLINHFSGYLLCFSWVKLESHKILVYTLRKYGLGSLRKIPTEGTPPVGPGSTCGKCSITLQQQQQLVYANKYITFWYRFLSMSSIHSIILLHVKLLWTIDILGDIKFKIRKYIYVSLNKPLSIVINLPD